MRGRRPRPVPIRARLDAHESPFGTSPEVRAAWEGQRAADPAKYGLNRYPDFLRIDMVEALARHHGLAVTNYAPLGGQGEVANVLAASLLRSPGAELVQSWPIDDPISRAARGWGGRVRRVALDREHRQDLTALAAAVGPATKLVHLQSPHDPGGAALTHAQLESFLEAVRARNPDAHVWLDESHAVWSARRDLPDGFAIIDRDREGSKLVVSRALPAAGFAGCPVAYAAASRALTEQMVGVTAGYVVPSFGWANEASVNRMGEKALLALLSDAGREHHARMRAQNREARQDLAGMLRDRRFRVVEGEGCWVLCRPPLKGRRFAAAGSLRRRGVLVLAAPAAWGARYRGWMRISVGTPAEHRVLERALARLYPRPARRRPNRYRRGRPPHASGVAPPATRRSVIAGAAALAAAGITIPRLEGERSLTRRRLLQGAAGAAALAYGISRSPGAGAFPPDSFYDRFDLARMLYHENPMGPHPAALEAVRAVLARGPDAARRGVPHDPTELVDAILRYNRGVRASVARLRRQHVMLTLGSAEGLFLAADTFVAGGKLVVEWPSYRIVRERVLHQRGTVIDVPLRPDWRPDYGALKQALRDHPDTGMVRLEAQNNPCGTVLRRGEFDDFAEHVFRHHPRTVILIDESDPEYMEAGPAAGVPDFPRYVAAGRNLVHIQTFSHVFALTGLRVGYAFGSPRLLARMRQKRIARPTNVFGLAAALATLRESAAQVRRAAPVVAEGRRFLYAELDRMGVRYLPSNGQYLFLDTGRSGTSVWASLIGLGVLTRYGREWGMEGWLRVNPGVPAENRRFIAALRTALSQPDPGNLPPLPVPLEPLLPRTAEGRALARGLEARLARDTWIADHTPALRRPYRVVRY